MKKAIFYSTRAIAGREGDNICRHFSILDQYDSIDYLTSAKTDAAKRLIQSRSMIKIDRQINTFVAWHNSVGKLLSDWYDVYSSLDVSCLQDYDALHIIGGLDFHNSNLGRSLSRKEVFPRDRGQMKFQSTAAHLVNILALLKAHREFGIPLHEIAFDPNEMSCDLFHRDVSPKDNYHLYHGYAVPAFQMKRLDSLQHHFNKCVSLAYDDKNFDFTFGYFILDDSGRQHYPAVINEIASQFINKNVYCKNEFTGENTIIAGDLYLEKIKQSRYTYMLPSYNKHCFSIYRFIESIKNDCLPLIHSDCNIEDVSKSFNVDMSVLVRSTAFSESDRIDILEMFKKKMLGVVENFR